MSSTLFLLRNLSTNEGLTIETKNKQNNRTLNETIFGIHPTCIFLAVAKASKNLKNTVNPKTHNLNNLYAQSSGDFTQLSFIFSLFNAALKMAVLQKKYCAIRFRLCAVL